MEKLIQLITVAGSLEKDQLALLAITLAPIVAALALLK